MLDHPFFLFDCQTTGTHPSHSYIIEAAWGLYQASWNPEDWPLQHYQIQLPAGETIPKRIQRLTGLTDAAEGKQLQIDYADLCQRFFLNWQQAGKPPILIHFAQFERPFLQAMTKHSGQDLSQLPPIICTHRLAKQSIPGLRSYSLRAVAGFYDYSLQELKRSNHHLRATAHVWQHLARQLTEKKSGAENLLDWLQNYRADTVQEKKFQSKVDDQLRLALPTGPGIYRMLDKAGHVLYVGKAKNLKSRVNSYFRGRSSKGSRLNEMLTRVDDISIEQHGSELEALLKESDEIKAWEPPYNRQLKGRHRQLSFLNLTTFSEQASNISSSRLPQPRQLVGPLPERLVQEVSNLLNRFIRADHSPVRLWGQDFAGDFFQEAWTQILVRYDLSADACRVANCWQLIKILATTTIAKRRFRQQELQIAMQQLTENIDDEEILDGLEEDDQQAAEWSVERLSYACEKSLAYFYYRCYQLRWCLRLMDSHAVWLDKSDTNKTVALRLDKGAYEFSYARSGLMSDIKVPPGWQRSYQERCQWLDLATYDRLGILYRYWRRLALREQEIRICLRPGLVMTENDCFHYFV